MNNDDKATPKVTIYSASWCGFCRMAKDYLNSKKVAFKDIDVDEDADAARYIVGKTGQAGVPVLEIGNETILGFDRPKIDAALSANHLV